MIPESIAGSSHASKAELDVFAFLRDVLVPDEEFRVWYEPRLGRKTPDFVIYSNLYGLVVLEVKGYSADKLIHLSSKKFTVRKDGRVESEDSPLEQAEKAYRDLMDCIKSRPELCHTDGPHKGKPLIPVGYCAAFPNIRQTVAEQRGLTSVVTPTQCLFAEDFEGDANEHSVQRRFMSRLRPVFGQRVQFRFPGLDNTQMKALRTALSPEVQLSSTRSSDIAALDLAQERIAKSIGEGHRILKGVVGSGKSIVVAARAKFLARCNPSWLILVLCYNVSLKSTLRLLIDSNSSSEMSERITVLHYHGLVKLLTNVNLYREESLPFEAWESELTKALEFCRVDGKQPAFQAILIDEGQDLDESMVTAIVGLLDPATDSLLFCYDPAQNVFGRRSPNWKQIGLHVQGRRPTKLTKCYRSTQEIVRLATGFMDFTVPNDDDLSTPLFPQASDIQGRRPVLRRLGNMIEICQHVVNGIAYYVEQAGYGWKDIGVIYASDVREFPLPLQRLFHARFGIEGTDKLFWVNQSSDHKYEFDPRADSVKLCTIESSKGLEFKIVFLVGIDKMPRSHRQAESEKNLVYVGMTRAQEVLHVPYCEEGPFIRKLTLVAEALQR